MSGLWKHQKKCSFYAKKTPDDNGAMFMEIMKQNCEFQKMLMEQNKQMVDLFTQKKVVQNNTNYNNIVNNNNKFNLNIFLNEMSDIFAIYS